MGKRRTARQRALQILFELEFQEGEVEAVLARQFRDAAGTPEVREFAARLVRGVVSRREELDELIRGASRHWRIARMGLIDRNVIRIAAFEMLDDRRLAPAVVINEALEIVKRFSGEESALFVNGVLDAIRKKLNDGNPEAEGSHERTQESAERRGPRARPRRKKE